MKKYGFLFLSIVILSNYVFAEFDTKPAAKEAKQIVAAGIRSSEERIRANAIEAAAVSGDANLINDIVTLLDDPSVIVKFSAAVALGDLQHTQSREKLILLTTNSDLNIVMASSYAMCKMGDASYMKNIEANAEDKNQTVRANAAMLLGKIGKKDSLPVLYKIKDDPESSNTAAFNATEAIARIGDQKIYRRIWAMLISVFADDRYMGAQAMAALGGQKGADALVSMLEDEIPEVRLTAAGQLGTLKETTGKTVVKEYLMGPVPEQKEVADRCNTMAALAIGQIGENELAEYLPKFLKSDSPYVQLAAAKSLLMLDKAR